MALKSSAFDRVPESTARVAKAAFPKGNPVTKVRDALGPIFSDAMFTAVYAERGRPAVSPARLALVTVLQFAEHLSDRQAADAVRSRIDWKYALALELTDPGFDASILVDFRARLLEGGLEHVLLAALLARLGEAGLVKARGHQRTDSTHVLAAIRALNRLECVGQTMRHALDTLAAVAPEWLRERIAPEWVERYGRRFEDSRLPESRAKRKELAEQIGRDGHVLLEELERHAPQWLRQVPAVEILRQVWVQQFYILKATLRWREAGDLPPASRMISSPYDVEVRYGKKRGFEWKGYKVHLTETCDPSLPLVITDVQTAPAPETDFEAVPAIQHALAGRHLRPDVQLVDTGYVTSDHLVTSQAEHGIDLVGPPLKDPSWQARAGEGFAVTAFTIEWEREQATCPQGVVSRSWSRGQNAHGQAIIRIGFAREDCQPCPSRGQCTRSSRGGRTLTVLNRAGHEALERARQREQTEAFVTLYRARAGIEGAISQATRVAGLRRSRYRGLAKTHLQHVATAAGLNIIRIGAWLAERPRAKTRQARFTTLVAAA